MKSSLRFACLLLLPLAGCGGPTPYEQGMAALNADDLPQAALHFQETLQSNPKDAGGWVGLGLVLYSQGKFVQAVDHHRQAIQLDPNRVEAYVGRAAACLQLREYDLAIADCNAALAIAPDTVAAYTTRGFAYSEKGAPRDAIASYSEAIQRGVTDGDVWMNRGNAYLDIKQYDEALKDYNEAIKLKPKNAGAFCNRGRIHTRQANWEQATKDYEAAIRIDRDLAYAYSGLAWVQSVSPNDKLRNGAQAVKLAGKACELSQWKDPYCIGVLAAAYAEIGHFPLAVQWQKKALDFEHSSFPPEELKKAQERLALFEMAKTYREQ
jgi:tetratricopeptide (TPR) repeat protein